MRNEGSVVIVIATLSWRAAKGQILLDGGDVNCGVILGGFLRKWYEKVGFHCIWEMFLQVGRFNFVSVWIFESRLIPIGSQEIPTDSLLRWVRVDIVEFWDDFGIAWG